MKYRNLPCAWCGGEYLDGAHVPTKFLIPMKNRSKLKGEWPVLPSCKECNQGFKLDEEWLAVHFASILYDFSDNAKRAFDGHITKHLSRNLSIAKRYNRYLKLIELEVDGQKLGVKTQVKLSKRDWKRLPKVAEMFSRGLYYYHTGVSAMGMKAKTVYLVPARWETFKKHMEGLKMINLFPGAFDYAFGITEKTKEAVFYIFIYGKPSFVVNLVTSERHELMEQRVANGEIKPDKLPGIELLG